MTFGGDTEKQAILRDRMIKKRKEIKESVYLSEIMSVLETEMKLLDIGCGTAHIIQKLAKRYESTSFVGLDILQAMLKVANLNVMGLPNVILVEGDGLKLPFPENSFDAVINRLAEYSPQEAYRVLRKDRYFFEYGLGPEADKEIREFFSDRIEKENFFFPKNMKEWKREVCKRIKDAGFVVDEIKDYKENEYYQSEDELMDLIEMVPLVRQFDREKDSGKINELAERYSEKNGIRITWHYYIAEARRV